VVKKLAEKHNHTESQRTQRSTEKTFEQTLFTTERTVVISHPAAHARIHLVIIPKKDIKNIW